jgi:hypothetical protein
MRREIFSCVAHTKLTKVISTPRVQLVVLYSIELDSYDTKKNTRTCQRECVVFASCHFDDWIVGKKGHKLRCQLVVSMTDTELSLIVLTPRVQLS